ncbi:MAG TPA: hypothetical protein VFE33_21805 [Thermoanaerobaculia bacterium]|nr:hypothetical protein [Thermoanaerobaculia bacterium]
MAVDRIRVGVCVLSFVATLGGLAARAQEAPADPAAPAPAATASDTGVLPKIRFGFEGRMSFRQSDEFRFPVKFGFKPIELPVGQTQAFEETVNQGSHFEVSKLILYVDADWSESLTAHGRLDFLDLYDRNPTSSGKKTDVKELWVRFGREDEPGVLPPGSRAYLKVGKLSHFERQNDRHLESYGLVSTAFNRFNDMGAELGVDAGRHLYCKLSSTVGNPVFLRDPNALAGDNGTPDFLRANPDPELKSGIVILYDTEVEDWNPKRNPQLSGAVGLRFADEGGKNALDVMVFGHQRKLSQGVSREGTFYLGDLQILRGPFSETPLKTIHGNDKREVGGNVWLYLGGFSLFAQYVDQKLAGLPRTGIEAEVAWTFDLPLLWAVDGRQLFPTIAPALRYSKLDNRFKNDPLTPAPSFAWDWTKIDAGLRLGIVPGMDLTVEYAKNDFILANGATRHENEFLSTLRFHL